MTAAAPAPASPPPAPAAAHPASRAPSWATWLLWGYVASLAFVTVNEIFCLDAMDILTPELHRWVYRLVDLHRIDATAVDGPEEVRGTVERLRATLARTRYERVPLPESLERRLEAFLEAGRFDRPEDLAFARQAVADAQQVARERLLEIEEFATLPVLIRWTLDDPDPRIRRVAFDLVVQISEKWAEGSGWDLSFRENRFGFDPDGPADERAAARRRWVGWLKSTDVPYKGIIL